MKSLYIKVVFVVLLSCGGVITNIANAGLINLNSGEFFATHGGAGTGDGRGISFQAIDDFSISSIGIEAWLFEQSFDVVIWDSTDGHQVNAQLASASAILGGGSFGWNDIAIDFDFLNGNYYAIGWRASDGGSGNWADSLTYYRDSALERTIDDKVNLIDGFQGYSAENFRNTVHPNLRMNIAVPEPSTIAIFALGIFGLLARRLKQS